MDYEEFLNTIFDDNKEKISDKAPKKQRTAEDIMAEIMPIVEADLKKGG